MKTVFAGIEEGDKLYVVYNDLNDYAQIAEAVVTGFTHWMYEVGDRFEKYGERPQTNINYEIPSTGIQFSRNLEYSINDTSFTDRPTYASKWNHFMKGSGFVRTFTTREEAVEHIIKGLECDMSSKRKDILKLEKEIQHSLENLKMYKN